VLLCNWRSSANQFVLAQGPLRPTASVFPTEHLQLCNILSGERVCRLQLLLVLASAVIIGTETRGSAATVKMLDIPIYSLGTDPHKISFPLLFQQFLYCCRGVPTSPLHRNSNSSTVACLFVAAVNVFIEPLPSNGCLLWFQYSGFQASCHNIKLHLILPSDTVYRYHLLFLFLTSTNRHLLPAHSQHIHDDRIASVYCNVLVLFVTTF
jgi:hypothetical protein